MNEISQYVRSPGWWFTVIVVGLIISTFGSLAAEYTRPPIDRALSTASNRWRSLSEAQQRRMEARITALVEGTMEDRLAERLHLYATFQDSNHYSLVSMLFLITGTAISTRLQDRQLGYFLLGFGTYAIGRAFIARNHGYVLRHAIAQAEGRLAQRSS